jgi:hypothetical protein
MKRGIISAIGSGLILLSDILLCGCGPSREQRIRAIFDKHKQEISNCQKLADSAGGSGMDTLGALQKGDLSGGLRTLGQQQESLGKYAQCIDDLKVRINRELKSKGLADAPEINRIWQEYNDRRNQPK